MTRWMTPALLALASSTMLPADDCLEVAASDPLARYHAAQASGDAEAMQQIFSVFGYAYGHVRDGCYTNLSPKAFAEEELPKLHAKGLVEEEICRLDEEDYGDFVVVTSRYRFYLRDHPDRQITGIKVVTIDKASGKITSMNYGELDDRLLAAVNSSSIR